MTTRSSGFTLIELLVVVALIGILAAVGVVAYSGYVDGTKRKSAENSMMQLSLAQTEYYSENSTYYGPSSGTDCNPTSTTSKATEAALVDGAELFTSKIGFNVCIVTNTTKNYYIVAKNESGDCKIKLDGKQKFYKDDC